MKKFKLFLSIFLSAGIILTACSDDDDDNPAPVNNNNNNNSGQSIAEIAIGSGQTDSLVVALSQVGLVSTFQGQGTFTVFAPTNQAFVDLLGTNPNWNGIEDIPNTLLTSVLNYHVLPVVVRSTDLTDDLYATTINTSGSSNEAAQIEVDVTGGVELNNVASVTQADIEATNGIVHLIDAVLLPANVVDIASADERFSTLVEALTAYQSFNYTTTLAAAGAPGPFTVFAPTNAAFDSLFIALGVSSVGQIDSVTLKNVLEYHVVAEANVQSDQLTQDQVIPTLGDSSLTVDLNGGAKLMTTNMSQGDVNIIVTDVQTTNGVIHAVDKVMLPN